MADPFQPKFADLVRNYTSSTGTGNFTLGPAVNGFTSFTAALQTGDAFYYSAIGVDKPAEREVGRGTLLANGQISRSPIGGTPTNFSTGTKSVALIAAAEWFTQIQSAGGVATGTGSNPAVPTRAALAAAPSSQVAALLAEPGREGMFVFDSSNLSAKVTADPGQGIYVAPASAPTGASGAWVRKLALGFYNVKWFGALGDGTTDDSLAFTRALAFLRDTGQGGNGASPNASGNGTLYVPVGVYNLASTTLDIYGTIRIRGEAVGGASGGASVLKWTGNVTGLRVQRGNTSGATGAAIPWVASGGGDGTIIEGLYLRGPYTSGAESAAHGIQLRAQALIRDCNINSFAGDGVFADATAGGALEGNANVAHLSRVRVTACRNGLYVDGADTNIWNVSACDFSGNRQWGVWDSSFLGNSYFGCHTSSNGLGTAFPTGVNVGSNFYRVVPGQEAWCAANAPSGTSASNQGWQFVQASTNYNYPLSWVAATPYRAGGSFYTDNSNARNVLTGCYAESDQLQSIFITPTLVLGGLGFAEPYYGSIYTTNEGITTSGGFIKNNNGGAVTARLGEKDESVALSIISGTHTTYWPFTFRLSFGHGAGGIFNPEDIWATYNNANTADLYRLTGPSTTEQFGTGVSQPYVLHAIKFALGAVGSARMLSYGSAAPATGNHAQGEFTFNSAPTAASPLLGWMVTTGGAPGTSTPAYVLTAPPAAVATSGSASDLNTGTLPVAQTAALTGDVTKAAGASATTIAAGAVTYAKIQNVSATDKLLGRASAGAGTIEEIALTAAGRALIDDADAAAQRATLGLGSAATAALDTDTALAANSDTRVASQRAVKLYVDTAVTGLLDFKGSIDCSANPNYPAASKGDVYVVSVAGKIGGGSGTSVDVGDQIAAQADNAGGTQAAVGASWFILEHNLQGAVLAGAATSSGLTVSATDKLLGRASAGAGAIEEIALTAAGRALIDDADAAAQRATLGLAAVAASGSGADLAAASVTYAKVQNVSATDKLLGRATAGAGVVEEIICTAAGRALIDDADAAAQRTTLGLAAVAASGSAADLSTGTLPAARMPALTGDVTTTAGAVATTIAAGAVTYAKIQNVAASRLLGNPTGTGAAPSEISLAGGLAFSGTTLSAAGALTPTSVAATGSVKSSSTGGVGYATGAGGAITQATSKSTGVTLNKDCGQLTMNAAALAAGALVEFVVTNSEVAATDTINVNLASGATTTNAYRYWISAVSAGSFKLCVENRSAGSLSEALVFNFAIVKAVNA